MESEAHAEEIEQRDVELHAIAEQLKRIRTLFAIALGCLALIVLPVAAIALKTARTAESNGSKISDVERVDRISQFRASWRGCARDMLERADQRVSDQAVAQLPGLRAIIPIELIEQSTRRRETTLPILNCDPNLCGDAPYGLSSHDQRQFVRLYAAGRLDAIPDLPGRPLPKCPIVGPPLQMRG